MMRVCVAVAMLMPFISAQSGVCVGDPNSLQCRGEVQADDATSLLQLQKTAVKATVSIQQDLSRLDDSYYRAWDPKLDLAANAAACFEHFMQTSQVGSDLDASERANFKDRFVDEIAVLAVGDKVEVTFAKHCAKALEDEKPALTVHTLAQLQNPASTVTYNMPPSLANFSMREFLRLLGDSGDKDPTANSAAEAMAQIRSETSNASSIPAALLGTGENHKTIPIPKSFDARERWPMCADVINLVGDQGSCGNCWAHTVGGIISDRLCITSGGAFASQISVAYLTSCMKLQEPWKTPDGCDGGFPIGTMAWAAKNGVPTGGKHGSACLSDLVSMGTSLGHQVYGKTTTAPPCPTSCTNADYARTLDEDRFFPEGMVLSGIEATYGDSGRKFEEAKAAIMRQGSIGLSIGVGSEFLAYKTGVYKPLGLTGGSHSVRAYGWGSDPEDHLLAVNSWGADWGEGGHFKIAASAVEKYYVPGDILGSNLSPRHVGYAYPLPGQGNAPSAPRIWEVTQGECTVDGSGCLLSPGYPNAYKPRSAACRFELNPLLDDFTNWAMKVDDHNWQNIGGRWQKLPIDNRWFTDKVRSYTFQDFKTYPGYDVLYIRSRRLYWYGPWERRTRFSGTDGPDGVVPGNLIFMSFYSSRGGDDYKFKICPDWPSSPAAPPTPYTK